MNELLGYLYGYGVPIAIVLGLLLAIVIAMGAALSWSRYIVFIYVVFVLIVPLSTSYGTLGGENTNNFWVKGTKSFFFSFLDMLIFGSWILGVLFVSGWTKRNKKDRYGSPMALWYVGLGLLFVGHVIVASFREDPILLEFTSRGIINIFWQGMLVSLLLVAVRTERDLKVFTWIIIICLMGQQTWGLFRYAFLGGDPQNYYENFGFTGVKITFWDITDSLFACLMVGLGAWKLLVDRKGGWAKIGYSIIILLGLLTPALSSRRTAQGALLIAMIVLFFLLPRGRRAPVLIALALVIPITLASLIARSGDSVVPIYEKIMLDIKFGTPKEDSKNDRFYELITAMETIKEQPFFGVGPSGSFKVTSDTGLEYHHGKYDFVHSAFLHVLLKTGVVGLFLFMGIFVTFFLHIKRNARYVLAEHKALYVGAICAFIAAFPNLMFANPLIEIRSMQLLAVLFAIPLICIAIGRKKAAENKNGVKKDEINTYFLPTIPQVKVKKT